MRRAMIRPISPEPRMSTALADHVALDIEVALRGTRGKYAAGRVPGMPIAPRVRSRQPMASTIASASSTS